MDKRKANGTETPENEDRVLKRRKLAEDYDLTKGESRDSTSAYGLSFLEQIRRTSDKNGRRVSVYFEELPPRAGNAEYYKRTRMPISLGMVEQKLMDGEFKNMSELESYLKRMISNAKEFFPRSSSTFDDAERVRKAVSNYMTKTNPAYQKRGYQAVPTPLPPEDGNSEEDAGEDEDDAKGEEAEEQEEEEEADDVEVDAKDDEAEKAEDEEPEEEEAVNDDEDVGRSSRKRSIILKRRGSTRLKRSPSSVQRRTSARFEHTPARPRSAHESKSERKSRSKPETKPESKPGSTPKSTPKSTRYTGLTFQQAQEKIIDELLEHTEPDYEGAYFEPFINLPPRALKDYFRMIQEPMSLRKLQRAVKGMTGRNEATGVSEFKNWAQFEEKCKLLWTNAYYYNEEGSDIYELTQELEKFVTEQLKQAAVAVPDPAPPKIKLKVGQSAEQSTPAKKITIHVGSGRGGSTEAPTPQPGQSVDSPDVNGASNGNVQARASEGARSVSIAVSPSPSVPAIQKSENASTAESPAVRPTSATSGQLTPGVAAIQQAALTPQPVPPPVPQAPVIPLEKKRLRGPGKGVTDALISSIRFYASNPANHADRPFMITVSPDARDMQQSATVSVPPTHTRVVLVTQLPEFLHDRQYSLWTLMNKQPLKANQQPHPSQHVAERVFEAMLHSGVNIIESHLIAAIPRADRVPGEPEVELEVFNIHVNVMRN